MASETPTPMQIRAVNYTINLDDGTAAYNHRIEQYHPEKGWQEIEVLEEGLKGQDDYIGTLEAKLALAEHGLQQCEAEIDHYIRHEYPGDNPVHARYRKRDFAANPARITLAQLKGGERG